MDSSTLLPPVATPPTALKSSSAKSTRPTVFVSSAVRRATGAASPTSPTSPFWWPKVPWAATASLRRARWSSHPLPLLNCALWKGDGEVVQCSNCHPATRASMSWNTTRCHKPVNHEPQRTGRPPSHDRPGSSTSTSVHGPTASLGLVVIDFSPKVLCRNSSRDVEHGHLGSAPTVR